MAVAASPPSLRPIPRARGRTAGRAVSDPLDHQVHRDRGFEAIVADPMGCDLPVGANPDAYATASSNPAAFVFANQSASPCGSPIARPLRAGAGAQTPRHADQCWARLGHQRVTLKPNRRQKGHRAASPDDGTTNLGIVGRSAFGNAGEVIRPSALPVLSEWGCAVAWDAAQGLGSANVLGASWRTPRLIVRPRRCRSRHRLPAPGYPILPMPPAPSRRSASWRWA
jgi:hypothetical protein